MVLSQTSSPILFQLMIFIIISCYGGAFATIPAFVKDIYGPNKMSSPFGFILIAWSVAAFVGPGLIGLTNDYTTIFYLFAGILMFTAIMCVILKQKLIYKE